MVDGYCDDRAGHSDTVTVRSMGDGMFALSQAEEGSTEAQTIILSLGQLKGLEGAVRASMGA